MDALNELSYKPPPEFEEVKKDSLVNLNIAVSTELWLIQWPFNQHPGLDGQEVSLKLHHDGHMGSFEDSSGKSYEVVSCRAQDPDAVVFLSSQSEPKIAGKISRRVSFIHYPEPSELKQNSINLKQMMAQRSSGTTTTLTNSSRRFATPSQSTRTRSIMQSGSSSKSTIRKHGDGQSVQDSGKSGRSVLTSSGSFDHSRDQKSNKKRKTDG
ncbi:mediator-associated protein 2-like [Solanum lycopersicum]|uniref:mediator-associated protein 2-like n=1 Tax=Solanum lycopersicum TaxID=4081 RepID=UPI0002763137|nr:mediator-associated protein 2-like [Solanum lycopersicum]